MYVAGDVLMSPASLSSQGREVPKSPCSQNPSPGLVQYPFQGPGRVQAGGNVRAGVRSAERPWGGEGSVGKGVGARGSKIGIGRW